MERWDRESFQAVGTAGDLRRGKLDHQARTLYLETIEGLCPITGLHQAGGRSDDIYVHVDAPEGPDEMPVGKSVNVYEETTTTRHTKENRMSEPTRHAIEAMVAIHGAWTSAGGVWPDEMRGAEIIDEAAELPQLISDLKDRAKNEGFWHRKAEAAEAEVTRLTAEAEVNADTVRRANNLAATVDSLVEQLKAENRKAFARGVQLDATARDLIDGQPLLDAQVDAVTHVLLTLGNPAKEQAIQHLFNGGSDYYLDEWRARNPFAFWCHLDLANRRKLMEWVLNRVERS